MTTRHVLIVALACSVSVGTLLARQANGMLAGKATDEAKKPYSDYAVQLRDVATGQITSTQPLSGEGRFSFSGVELSRRYLVELFQTKERKVVCTEGPYMLTAGSMPNKTDINIDCGKTPAALWLLLAGAGAAGAIAIVTRSSSK
jgi:hypothetical protein